MMSDNYRAINESLRKELDLMEQQVVLLRSQVKSQKDRAHAMESERAMLQLQLEETNREHMREMAMMRESMKMLQLEKKQFELKYLALREEIEVSHEVAKLDPDNKDSVRSNWRSYHDSIFNPAEQSSGSSSDSPLTGQALNLPQQPLRKRQPLRSRSTSNPPVEVDSSVNEALQLEMLLSSVEEFDSRLSTRYSPPGSSVASSISSLQSVGESSTKVKIQSPLQAPREVSTSTSLSSQDEPLFVQAQGTEMDIRPFLKKKARRKDVWADFSEDASPKSRAPRLEASNRVGVGFLGEDEKIVDATVIYDRSGSKCLVAIVTSEDDLTRVTMLEALSHSENVVNRFGICEHGTFRCFNFVQFGGTFQRGEVLFPDLLVGTLEGDLLVYSSATRWEELIYIRRWQTPISAILSVKKFALVLLEDSRLSVLSTRYDIGEALMKDKVLTTDQKHGSPASAVAVVNKGVWIASGNTVHAVSAYHSRIEAEFQVHVDDSAVVAEMLNVRGGVWLSFKMESILCLYSARNFNKIQVVDTARFIHKMLKFNQESNVLIQVSTMVATPFGLWVGTENGIIVYYPLPSAPKTIRVADSQTPRMASQLAAASKSDVDGLADMTRSGAVVEDEAKLSLHCHVHGVKRLLAMSIGSHSLLGRPLPSHVMSFGEGHIDLHSSVDLRDEEVSGLNEPKDYYVLKWKD